jgi:hypothetical protein
MRKVSQILATGALIGGLATPAWANSITFVTPTGATTGGGPVDASAQFTTGAGSLTITLTNLQANITDVAQALSDLLFTVHSASGASLGMTTAIVGTAPQGTVTVASGGSYTTGTTSSDGWQATGSSNSFLLNDLCGSGCSGPADLIIGGPGAGNLYTNANGSIAGAPSHNPFLFESALFTLNIPGLTASDTISAATFSFGTTAGIDVPGIPGSTVPEPASLLLLGSGLIGAGVRRFRSRRTAA